MTRCKIQLQYIKSDSARNSTLKKRKSGLIKKMHELSTLCGIDSCIVIYSPNCPEPEMWPSRSAAEQITQHYKNMTRHEKSKKMVDQESFAQQEIICGANLRNSKSFHSFLLAKAREQLDKIQKQNMLKELNVMVNKTMSNDRGWVQSLDFDYLTYMNNHVLERQLEKMESRIAKLNLKPSATPQE